MPSESARSARWIMPKANHFITPQKRPHLLSANLHLTNLLWVHFCVQGCLAHGNLVTSFIFRLGASVGVISTGGGGLHRGGIAPPPPPNFGLQYKGVPKSPLLSLFCNSVFWLKPHNNVNSRPPNLAVLPPPLQQHSYSLKMFIVFVALGQPFPQVHLGSTDFQFK